VLYPFPRAWPTWQVAGAVLAVVGVSLLAFGQAKRRPYAFTGWFWYLGTLVPVIGLVQVGAQSLADRYTYVPLIGLFIIVAWGGYELAARLQLRPFALASLPALPLLACVPLTRMQLHYWQDSLTLFDHAVRCTSNNSMMENNLGAALTERGELDAAVEHLGKAVKILPSDAKAHLNLGIVLARQGKSAEAIRSYRFALAYGPDLSAAHFRLAVELIKQREPAEATGHITDALRLGISRREVYAILGLPLPKQGMPPAESGQLPGESALNPTNAEVLSCVAMALDRLGRVRDAVAEYQEALRYNPHALSALNNLAWILASDPNPDVRDGKESVRLAEAACRRDGYKDATLVSTLGVAYAEEGRFAEAAEMANRAEAMARAAGNIELAGKNRQRAGLFRAGQPYREPPVSIIAAPARRNP
jgi:tetratricopeptide (TPR) repeat protein